MSQLPQADTTEATLTTLRYYHRKIGRLSSGCSWCPDNVLPLTVHSARSGSSESHAESLSWETSYVVQPDYALQYSNKDRQIMSVKTKMDITTAYAFTQLMSMDIAYTGQDPYSIVNSLTSHVMSETLTLPSRGNPDKYRSIMSRVDNSKAFKMSELDLNGSLNEKKLFCYPRISGG